MPDSPALKKHFTKLKRFAHVHIASDGLLCIISYTITLLVVEKGTMALHTPCKLTLLGLVVVKWIPSEGLNRR